MGILLPQQNILREKHIKISSHILIIIKIFFKPFIETTELLQHLCKNNFLLRLIVVPFLLLCFVMFIVCAILILLNPMMMSFIQEAV